MAENPFAQFVQPGIAVSDNPFARFATPELRPALEGTVRPDPKDMAPAELAKYEFGIDITGPKQEVRAQIGALPKERRKPAMELWAKHFRAEEKKTRTPGQQTLDKVNDVFETIARGTPIGSWGDEIDAGLKSAAYNLTSGLVGAPYDEAVAYNRERQAEFDRENPYASLGLKIAGGVGTALAVPLPAIQVAKSAPMLSKMGAGGATGVGYGAVYGAGEGGDLGSSDQLAETAKGMAFGGGIGTVVPPVAAAVGNAAKVVADNYRKIPPQLAGMNRNAVKQLSDDMGADRLYQPNGAPPPPGYQSYGDKRNALGWEGMLADMGDNLGGRAAGLANVPGQSKTIVRDALQARAAGAPDRIRQTVDDVLGPEQNLVKVEEDVTKATQQAAKPFYDQFNATPIKATDKLIGIVQRIPQAAWSKAKMLAEAEGVDLNQVINTGRGLDLLKRGVDDLAGAAKPGSNEQRIFGGLARALRTEVDSILSPANPSQSSWARGRALSGEGKQFAEALDEGGKVFNPSVHPDRFAADLRGATPVEQAATVYGARGQIRDKMGNAMSRNNTAEANIAAAGKVRDLLSSDYARQKLDTMLKLPVATYGGSARQGLPLGYTKLGNGRGGDLISRLDAETQFARTQNTATGNSVTAARQATIKDIGPTTGGEAAAEAGRKGPMGLATEYAWKAANALLGGAMEAGKAAKAVDMARMLVAQGKSRDDIALALIRYGQSRAITTQGKEALTRLAQDILESPRFAFIDEAASRPDGRKTP